MSQEKAQEKKTVATAALLIERGWTDDRIVALGDVIETSTFGAYAVGAALVAANLNWEAAREELRDRGIRRRMTLDAYTGANSGAYRHRGYILDTLAHCGLSLSTYDAVQDVALVQRASEVPVSVIVDSRELIAHVAARSDDASRGEACWTALVEYRDGDETRRDTMWAAMREAQAKAAGRAQEAAQAALAAIPEDAPQDVRTAAETAVTAAETAVQTARDAQVKPRPKGKTGKRPTGNAKPDTVHSLSFEPGQYDEISAAHSRYNGTLTRGKRPNVSAFVHLAVRAFEASGWTVPARDWTPNT